MIKEFDIKIGIKNEQRKIIIKGSRIFNQRK